MKYLLSLLLLISFTVSAQDTVTITHKAYKTTYSKSKHYPVKVEWWVTKASLTCPVKVKRGDKFIHTKKTNEWLAFLFDNNTSKADGLKNNEVNVAEIEKLTGFKFK